MKQHFIELLARVLGLSDFKRYGHGIAGLGGVPQLLRFFDIKINAHSAFGHLFGFGIVLCLNRLGIDLVVYLIKIDAVGGIDRGGVIDRCRLYFKGLQYQTAQLVGIDPDALAALDKLELCLFNVNSVALPQICVVFRQSGVHLCPDTLGVCRREHIGGSRLAGDTSEIRFQII